MKNYQIAWCKSIVLRCMRYDMNVGLDVVPLEEVDYFKYLGSHVAIGGECEIDMVQSMNAVYKVWEHCSVC